MPKSMAQLGVVIFDLDIYFGSASQLEGEKSIHVPCVESELHAAPSAPQFFLFRFHPHYLAHENPPGEGAGTEWHTIDIRPKPSKPPNPHVEDLQGECR